MRKHYLRNAFIAVALSIPLVITSSCKDDDDMREANEVFIENDAFIPSTITVVPGTIVTWENREDDLHTVTSDVNLFDSGDMSKDDKFSFTFSALGSFPYHCKHHSNMHGTIVVE